MPCPQKEAGLPPPGKGQEWSVAATWPCSFTDRPWKGHSTWPFQGAGEGETSDSACHVALSPAGRAGRWKHSPFGKYRHQGHTGEKLTQVGVRICKHFSEMTFEVIHLKGQSMNSPAYDKPNAKWLEQKRASISVSNLTVQGRWLPGTHSQERVWWLHSQAHSPLACGGSSSHRQPQALVIQPRKQKVSLSQ